MVIYIKSIGIGVCCDVQIGQILLEIPRSLVLQLRRRLFPWHFPHWARHGHPSASLAISLIQLSHLLFEYLISYLFKFVFFILTLWLEIVQAFALVILNRSRLNQPVMGDQLLVSLELLFNVLQQRKCILLVNFVKLSLLGIRRRPSLNICCSLCSVWIIRLYIILRVSFRCDHMIYVFVN